MNDVLIDGLTARVRVFQNFPAPGIAFQDLAPIYASPGALGMIGKALARAFSDNFDVVLAVEARGFLIGSAVAIATDRPLILARKQGKLPGSLHSSEYALEYGAAVLTLQRGDLNPDWRILVVDDVLATGGTLAAAADLVCQAGATVAGFGVLMEVAALGGRQRLAPTPVEALLRSS
jgi:adenine phosphoribosyltransferase